MYSEYPLDQANPGLGLLHSHSPLNGECEVFGCRATGQAVQMPGQRIHLAGKLGTRRTPGQMLLDGLLELIIAVFGCNHNDYPAKLCATHSGTPPLSSR